MKTNIHIWSYLTQFFLEWGIFGANLVEKNEKLFMFNNVVTEIRAVYEKM
jgi:hypothetical protein